MVWQKNIFYIIYTIALYTLVSCQTNSKTEALNIRNKNTNDCQEYEICNYGSFENISQDKVVSINDFY